MKCITYNCKNCSDEGNGRTICVEPDNDGWICEPCWIFLTKSIGRLNQLYDNGKRVSEERRQDQDSYYAGQAGQNTEETAQVEIESMRSHCYVGISGLAYGDLVRASNMDKVREGRLNFNNFFLDEKVYLKLAGVTLYQGDTYDRDACRCENFACDERWHQNTSRPGNWRYSHQYLRHIEILKEHQELMATQERNNYRARLLCGQ